MVMITFNLCHSLLLLRWHSTEAGCDTNQRKFQNDYLPCQHFLWPAAAEEQPNLCLLFQRLGLLSLRSSNLLAGKFLCNPLRDNANLGKSQARKSNIGMGFVTVFPFSNRVHSRRMHETTIAGWSRSILQKPRISFWNNSRWTFPDGD